jgi:hypothetical protein
MTQAGYTWSANMSSFAYKKTKVYSFNTLSTILFLGTPLLMAYIAREKMATITAYAAVMDEQSQHGNLGFGAGNPMADGGAAPAKL